MLRDIHSISGFVLSVVNNKMRNACILLQQRYCIQIMLLVSYIKIKLYVVLLASLLRS